MVQEVALGTFNPLIVCGNDRLDWPTFVSAALASGLSENCNRLRVLQEIRARARIPPRLRYAGNQLPGAFEIRQPYADDLFYLLNRTRDFEPTDPRDKLFALLGLTRGLSADLTVADYKRPVRDVFLELAETAMTRSHSLYHRHQARLLLIAFLHGSRISLQNELPPCLDSRASTA